MLESLSSETWAYEAKYILWDAQELNHICEWFEFSSCLKLGKAKRFRVDSRGESGQRKAIKALFSSQKETQMNQLANLSFWPCWNFANIKLKNKSDFGGFLWPEVKRLNSKNPQIPILGFQSVAKTLGKDDWRFG